LDAFFYACASLRCNPGLPRIGGSGNWLIDRVQAQGQPIESIVKYAQLMLLRKHISRENLVSHLSRYMFFYLVLFRNCVFRLFEIRRYRFRFDLGLNARFNLRGSFLISEKLHPWRSVESKNERSHSRTRCDLRDMGMMRTEFRPWDMESFSLVNISKIVEFTTSLAPSNSRIQSVIDFVYLLVLALR